MQHTPAPWTLDGYSILDERERELASIYRATSPGAGDIPEWRANAALIVAAPELYEALQAVLAAPFDSTNRSRVYLSHAVLEMLRAALDKAQPDL
jgi:hypothetical protein